MVGPEAKGFFFTCARTPVIRKYWLFTTVNNMYRQLSSTKLVLSFLQQLLLFGAFILVIEWLVKTTSRALYVLSFFATSFQLNRYFITLDAVMTFLNRLMAIGLSFFL